MSSQADNLKSPAFSHAPGQTSVKSVSKLCNLETAISLSGLRLRQMNHTSSIQQPRCPPVVNERFPRLSSRLGRDMGHGTIKVRRPDAALPDSAMRFT